MISTIFLIILSLLHHRVVANSCTNVKYVPQGGTITLTCGRIFSKNEVIFTWYADFDVTVIVRHSLRTGNYSYPNEDTYSRDKFLYNEVAHTLTIANFNEADQRCYQCVVTAGDASVATAYNLFITITANTITLISSPGTTVSEEEIVTLICVTDGAQPTTEVLWTKDGQMVNATTMSVIDGANDLKRRRSTLELRAERSLNGNKYRCAVVGQLNVYKEITLQVLLPASNITFTSFPSTALSEGEKVTLTCETDEAQPTAEIVWTRDGQTVAASTISTVNGTNNMKRRRSILKVTADRSLHGSKYRCAVVGQSNIYKEKMFLILYLKPGNEENVNHCYLGLVIGLSMTSLVAILTGTILVIYCVHVKRTLNRKPKKHLQQNTTEYPPYIDVSENNDSVQYEKTRPHEVAVPSVYAQLQKTTDGESQEYVNIM